MVTVPYSVTLLSMGLYYPFFYLQLDAIDHKVNETFSLYIVSQLLSSRGHYQEPSSSTLSSRF